MPRRMSSVGDIFSGAWSQSQSDIDRESYPNAMSWASQPIPTMEGPNGFIGTTTPHMHPIADMSKPDTVDSTLFMSDGTQAPYPYSMEFQSWSFNPGQTMFDTDHLALDTASSSGSYAPSLIDPDQLAKSPAFSTRGSISGPLSVMLSPDIRDQPATILPKMEFDEIVDDSSEAGDSDDILNSLLRGLEPRKNGQYICRDANAAEHKCDYAADRKCMLRKHLESTLKTNFCHHKDCNNMSFSSKAVLTRHEKEAHGMHAANPFYCPVSTCERHTRGFPREYNMGDHIQRVHRDLNVNDYLKKTKRSRKNSTSTLSNATASSSRSNITNSTSSSGVRKISSSRHKKERLEKQYRQSRQQMNELIFNLPEQSTASAQKSVEQIKLQLIKLEDVIAELHSTSNG